MNSQQNTPDTTHTPREVMRPASTASPEAPYVPQRPERNVSPNVMTPSVLNNPGFAAALDEQNDQYENYYSIPGRYLEK
jgi:hypothetical protein